MGVLKIYDGSQWVEALPSAIGLSTAITWDTKAATLRATRSDENVMLFYNPVTMTAISAHTICVGTSPSVTWELRYGTDRSDYTGGTLLVSGTSTGTTTIENTNISTSLPAGNMVWLLTTATGGTEVTEFHCTFSYSGV